MILLLSQDSLEPATEDVDNWLTYLGANHLRINGADILKKYLPVVSFNNHTASITFTATDGRQLNLDEVNAVWFRRWQYYAAFDKVSSTGDELFEESANEYRVSEFRALTRILFNFLKDKPIIGNPGYLFKLPAKFEQLMVAARAGIAIPNSIITGSKAELLSFYAAADKKVITKANDEGLSIVVGKSDLGIYTTLLTDDIIKLVPDSFYPGLFQQFQEKELELRVFYLHKKCYAMAIFSSMDRQTEVDLRVYNYDRPNRTVPFNLPADLQQKIVNFMESIGLNTGSLDLILTRNNEFVFLEVNPGGQFGWVSFPCNYYLEKIIAEELIAIDHAIN